MSFFKKDTVKKPEDTQEIKELKSKIKQLECKDDERNRNHSIVIQDIERKHKIEVEDIIRSHTNETNKLKFEAEKSAQTALSASTEAKKKLEIENGVLTKEVEILRKAFANMGFEVKDMKEILNKLVDGVVSKNTINVVK